MLQQDRSIKPAIALKRRLVPILATTLNQILLQTIPTITRIHVVALVSTILLVEEPNSDAIVPIK
jgi:hypothetical protein